MKTELEERTKEFSVKIVRLIRTFPKTVDGIEVGRQLLRSATSIGANYREANRAESKQDCIHKVGVAEKEASETVYWLEICEVAPLGDTEDVRTLLQEAKELLAIVTTIGRKAKGRTHRLADAVVSLGALAVGLFSLSRFPAFRFSFVMIIARSPLRVTLGGGGTDLPSYYEKFGGFLIAGAIDKYVYITLHETFVPDLIVKYSELERVPNAAQAETSDFPRGVCSARHGRRSRWK